MSSPEIRKGICSIAKLQNYARKRYWQADFEPMDRAVIFGRVDIVKLLSYIGLDITREHLLAAARYGCVDMIKLFLNPNNDISDEWLNQHRIDIEGRKKLRFTFNVNSRKTRNFMKQFYNIAVGKDNLELWKYLEEIGIENLFLDEYGSVKCDHMEDLIKTSSKISIYLIERNNMDIKIEPLARNCLRYCCRYGSEKVFFYLINNSDGFGQWKSEPNLRNAYLRICLDEITNSIAPRRVKIAKYLVQETGVRGSPVLNYMEALNPNDVIGQHLKDLIYNKIEPPKDFSREVFERASADFIGTCIEAKIVDINQLNIRKIVGLSHGSFLNNIIRVIARCLPERLDELIEAYIEVALEPDWNMAQLDLKQVIRNRCLQLRTIYLPDHYEQINFNEKRLIENNSLHIDKK
jgi:hypothetical protein